MAGLPHGLVEGRGLIDAHSITNSNQPAIQHVHSLDDWTFWRDFFYWMKMRRVYPPRPLEETPTHHDTLKYATISHLKHCYEWYSVLAPCKLRIIHETNPIYSAKSCQKAFLSQIRTLIRRLEYTNSSHEKYCEDIERIVLNVDDLFEAGIVGAHDVKFQKWVPGIKLRKLWCIPRPIFPSI